MNQKGFSIIILVVVIFVLVGTVGYFAIVKKAAQKIPLMPQQTAVFTPWQTYRNVLYGYELNYPPEYKLICSANTEGPTYTPLENCKVIHLEAESTSEIANRITKGESRPFTWQEGDEYSKLAYETSLKIVNMKIIENPQKLSLVEFVKESKERGYPAPYFVISGQGGGRGVDLELDKVVFGNIKNKEALIYPMKDKVSVRDEPAKGKVGYIKFSDNKVLYFDLFVDRRAPLSESILDSLKFPN